MKHLPGLKIPGNLWWEDQIRKKKDHENAVKEHELLLLKINDFADDKDKEEEKAEKRKKTILAIVIILIIIIVIIVSIVIFKK